MLLSATRGKLAVWLLLAASAAAQDPCSDVTTQGKVVEWPSGDLLTVDTTLKVNARLTVGEHDSPEIRVKLTTRGAGADLVEVLVAGSTVTIKGGSKCAGLECGPNATCDPKIGTCDCVNGYSGDFCQLAPENCRDGAKNGKEEGVDCGGPDCNKCTALRWFADTWGDCSVSCGGGTRARKVWCEDMSSPGVALPDVECANLDHDKPKENEACGVSECASYQWEYTDWTECTAVCGGGTRTRDAWCSSSLATKPVSDSLCGARENPGTSEDCNQGTCDTYHWVTDWGECSLPCGEGRQTATVTCKTADKTNADSSMCKDKMPSNTRLCNKAPCPVAEGTGKWTSCPWDACTTECGGSSSTMSGSQSRVVLCRDPITGAVTDPVLCSVADRPREILSGCNPMLCAGPYWMTTPWSSCGTTGALAGIRTRLHHCHDTNGGNSANALCEDAGLPIPVLEGACEVNGCPTKPPVDSIVDTPTVSWAAATSCPAPLLPLAVAATAWAVTPPGGPARRVSLASSLAFVAWTVSGVDAQADLADQECTSPLEIEIELQFPRSGSLGYDQVMMNGGFTIADTVQLVGCVPGYILQEGLCAPSVTSFDVYAEPSSKAFNKWSPDARYPKECPTYIHDMFAVLGDDGKVYPTWHPPVYTEDPPSSYTCNFGHEHGGDPSTSNAFASEAVPFGFVNERHYADEPTRERHESHVGHKLQVANDVKVCRYNKQADCEGKKHIATCQVMVKLHQGTSSSDAFVNNHHEVFLFVKCEPGGSTYLFGEPPVEVKYTRVDLKLKYLHGFGKPGELEAIDACPLFPDHQFKVDLGVLPITPADSPVGDGHRKMVDNTCVDEKILVEDGKQTQWITSNEHWVMNFNMGERGGSYSNEQCSGAECQKVSVYSNPYIFNGDAARYYDATSPETNFLKYFVDLCYEMGAKQVREGEYGENWCDQVRKEKDVTWDDPRSPWKGTRRSMSLNQVRVENPGPASVFYSDTYGQNLVTDRSLCGPKQNGVGCVTQYIGVATTGEVGADLFLPMEDFAVPSIHPPN